MKILNIFFILFLLNFGYLDKSFGQKWDELDDSTYYHIVAHRFDKKNISVGISGTIKVSNSDGLRSFGFGVRPRIGYFIKTHWLLSAYADIFKGFLIQEPNIDMANYQKIEAGISLRYYIKPKARAIFFQISPGIGKETQISDFPAEYENYNNTFWGGSLGIGLSAFVRRFELELLAGINITSLSIEKNEPIGTFMQINLSYIFK